MTRHPPPINQTLAHAPMLSRGSGWSDPQVCKSHQRRQSLICAMQTHLTQASHPVWSASTVVATCLGTHPVWFPTQVAHELRTVYHEGLSTYSFPKQQWWDHWKKHTWNKVVHDEVFATAEFEHLLSGIFLWGETTLKLNVTNFFTTSSSTSAPPLIETHPGANLVRPSSTSTNQKSQVCRNNAQRSRLHKDATTDKHENCAREFWSPAPVLTFCAWEWKSTVWSWSFQQGPTPQAGSPGHVPVGLGAVWLHSWVTGQWAGPLGQRALFQTGGSQAPCKGSPKLNLSQPWVRYPVPQADLQPWAPPLESRLTHF